MVQCILSVVTTLVPQDDDIEVDDSNVSAGKSMFPFSSVHVSSRNMKQGNHRQSKYLTRSVLAYSCAPSVLLSDLSHAVHSALLYSLPRAHMYSLL